MYRIHGNESASEFTRRVIGEEVDSVCGLLETTARGSLDHRVHEARVHLKKLRAVFELGAGMLERRDRRREIRATRAAAHVLAKLRGPVALIEAFDGTLSRFPDVLTPSAATAIRRDLGRSGGDSAGSNVLATARGHVTRMRSRIADLRIEPDGWVDLAPGLVETYARARRAHARAGRNHADEFHTMRRWAKRHSHHLSLLEPLWPGPLKAQRKEISKLCQDLGQEHDLSLLALELSRGRSSRPRASGLQEPIAGWRSSLQLAAVAAGNILFAETPAALGQRFAVYFGAFSARPLQVKSS